MRRDSLLSVLLAAAVFAGCSEDADVLSQIRLSASTLKMQVCETGTLQAWPVPRQAEIDGLRWACSPDSVATVDENGLVRALASGMAIVTASANGLTACCTVLVVNANITDRFDRVFAQQLYKAGYIPYASSITVEDVKDIKELRIPDAYGMRSMAGIEYFESLEVLDCSEGMVDTLDLSKNSRLRELNCSFNGLVSLDVSGCPELKTVDCSGNYPESLDFADNPKLEKLDCSSSYLQSLDVTGCEELMELDCSINKLQSLDVTGNPKLERLNCFDNELSRLDVGSLSGLKELDCWANKLESLDLAANPMLEKVDCSVNAITSLDAGHLELLAELRCTSNPLESLKVNRSSLKVLDCFDSALETLDVSGGTSLSRLNCFRSRLRTLDISGCVQLSALYCYENLLTELDISDYALLSELSCYDNLLTELDISDNKQLSYVNFSSNPGRNGTFVVPAWFGSDAIPSGFPREGWWYYTSDESFWVEIEYRKKE